MCEKFITEHIGPGTYKWFFELTMARSVQQLIKEQHSKGRMVAM